MGCDLNSFVTKVDEEFICPICTIVLENSMQSQNCEQTYCDECISEWLSINKECPVDSKQLYAEEIKPIPRILCKFLCKLEIKCNFDIANASPIQLMSINTNNLTLNTRVYADSSETLKGFDWRGRQERHTAGYWMQTEPLSNTEENRNEAILFNKSKTREPIKLKQKLKAHYNEEKTNEAYNILGKRTNQIGEVYKSSNSYHIEKEISKTFLINELESNRVLKEIFQVSKMNTEKIIEFRFLYITLSDFGLTTIRAIVRKEKTKYYTTDNIMYTEKEQGSKYEIYNWRSFHKYGNPLDNSLKTCKIKPIYISYSSIDATSKAIKLKYWLRHFNCDVYLDVDEIKVGLNWRKELEKAVKDCGTFVALITPTYGNTFYKRREIQRALKLNKRVIFLSLMARNLNEESVVIGGLETLENNEELNKVKHGCNSFEDDSEVKGMAKFIALN